MSLKEDALLARLNALRQSSISLDTSPRLEAPTTPKPKSSTTTTFPVDSDLTARFRNLTPSSRLPLEEEEEEEEEDTPHNDEDEQSLEDLIQQLGPDEQWTLDPDEPQHINKLLAEAKAALPSDADGQGEHSESVKQHADDLQSAEEELRKDLDIEITAETHPNEEKQDDRDDSDEEKEDATDEQDADDYIQKVLAELNLDSKYGDDNDDDTPADPSAEAAVYSVSSTDISHDDDDNNNKTLALPSTPTALPPPRTQQFPAVRSSSSPLAIDASLAARFASLGAKANPSSSEQEDSDLALPSAPSFNPTQKPVSITKSIHKSNLPTYTDEDIESWCCICNEDAEVKCLGCEGDLYCAGCWREGHGMGPGQEKGHKAVRYSKDKKGKRRAAAA